MTRPTWTPGPLPDTKPQTARQLFEEYLVTVAMLRDAQAQHRRAEDDVRAAQEALQEAGNVCLVLAAEEARLVEAIRRAAAEEVGLPMGETAQESPQTLTEALAGAPPMRGENGAAPDYGG